MKRELSRDILSAIADHEATSEESTAVAKHVATCRACGAYAQQITALDRQVRIRPAEPVPDLIAAVTSRARPAKLDFGLLPFTAALVGATIVRLGADVVGNGRSPLAESVHLTELIGLALVWMFSGSPGWHGWRSRSPHRRLPRLDPLQ
jgi:anti-sigma factor RsiW